MSNINESVLVAMEGRALGTTVAALTGLGGLFTGGGLAGSYQAHKGNTALKAKAMEKGDGKAYMKADSLKHLYGHGILGSIPGYGAISNTLAASRRYDAEEELKGKKSK